MHDASGALIIVNASLSLITLKRHFKVNIVLFTGAATSSRVEDQGEEPSLPTSGHAAEQDSVEGRIAKGNFLGRSIIGRELT